MRLLTRRRLRILRLLRHDIQEQLQLLQLLQRIPTLKRAVHFREHVFRAARFALGKQSFIFGAGRRRAAPEPTTIILCLRSGPSRNFTGATDVLSYLFESVWYQVPVA